MVATVLALVAALTLALLGCVIYLLHEVAVERRLAAGAESFVPR